VPKVYRVFKVDYPLKVRRERKVSKGLRVPSVLKVDRELKVV
jgi:hypothetical protein